MDRRRTQTTHKRSNPRRGIFLVAALLIVSLLGYELAASGVLQRYFAPKHTSPATTAGQYTKGESPSPANTSPQSNTQPGDNKSTTGAGDPNAVLLDPTGNFVSTHHISLSGASGTATLQSTCNTTPGATCQITFTKDGVVKSLPKQTTDRGGATYWNWKLQDIGLSEGSWQVTAIAALGSQSKNANDALALEVNQ